MPIGAYVAIGLVLATAVALGLLLPHIWDAWRSTRPVTGPAPEQLPEQPAAELEEDIPARPMPSRGELAGELADELRDRPEGFPMIERPASLYDLYGGRAALRLVMVDFYDRMLTDPTLAPAFTGMDVGRIKRHMLLLLSILMGAEGQDADQAWRQLGDIGVGKMSGPSAMLYRKHFGLNITDAMFNRTAGHLDGALTDAAGMAPEHRAVLMGKVGQFRPMIVTPRVLADAEAAASDAPPL